MEVLLHMASEVSWYLSTCLDPYVVVISARVMFELHEHGCRLWSTCRILDCVHVMYHLSCACEVLACS